MGASSDLRVHVHEHDPCAAIANPCKIVAKNQYSYSDSRQNESKVTVLDKRVTSTGQPLCLGRRVGIFPEFQIEFLYDDGKYNQLT
jgi:hypothetical protein